MLAVEPKTATVTFGENSKTVFKYVSEKVCVIKLTSIICLDFKFICNNGAFYKISHVFDNVSNGFE